MLNGLYVSGSGMLAELRRQDVIANNLANAATNGYKRDIPVSSEFSLVLSDQLSDPVGYIAGTRVAPIVGSSVTDFAPGSVRATGNSLDLALAGNGFFVIQTANGIRYTRNGNFRIDANGVLVTATGQPVLGSNGAAINLGTDNVAVDAQGRLILPGGQVAGQIGVVAFADPTQLIKVGDNLFQAGPGAQATTADVGQVRQGFLEGANVNPVHEMVAMIEVQRAYEANQKVIKTTDQTLEVAVSQVGRI